MQRFIAAEFEGNLAELPEAAMREPPVSYLGRDRLVVLPVADYETPSRQGTLVMDMENMPDEFVAALPHPYDNPEQAAHDHLLD